MQLLSDKLTKSILDPIHGLIRMTEEEMKIISHPLFHRLRGIKQNTFLYYVFPSANHTRFEHSIGVMHLASEMLLNSFHNASTLIGKREKYGLEKLSNILEKDDFVNFEEILMDLRIAALLHDIGHGPMSHLFDEFAPSNKDFLSIIKEDQDLDKGEVDLSKELSDSLYALVNNSDQKTLEGPVEHEFVSYYFSSLVLRSNDFSANRIKKILTIMNSELELSKEIINKNNERYDLIPFLNQIVAGAPLDCDRMDYLLRDSYFTGVKYGTYDLNRLLKSLLPFIDEDNKEVRLGIKKSGLPAIENFLQARYELYVQVYYHKTNQACNEMLKQATRNLENNLEFLNFNDPKELKQTYLKLSDENFLRLIREELKMKSSNDVSILDDLISRRLWKRVYEIHQSDVGGEEELKNTFEKVKNKVQNIIANEEKYMGVNFITKNPVKDLSDEKAVLLKKDENEEYKIQNYKGWMSSSPIFQALSNNYMVGRIYLKVNEEDGITKKKFRDIKQELTKIE